MNDKCAGCNHVFTVKPLIGAFNTFIGERRYASSLFGAHDIWLCEHCSKIEEALIENEGNDHQWLLQAYRGDSVFLTGDSCAEYCDPRA